MRQEGGFWMKKLFCGILSAILLFGCLTGCQFPRVSQEEYDQMASKLDELQQKLDEIQAATPTDNTSSTEPQADNSSSTQAQEPLVIVDQDGVKISFLGLGESYLGPSIKLKIENNTDQNITVQQRDMSINGIMMNGIFSSDVSPGKIANDSIDILDSDLEENSISQIENVELSFVVFNADSWDDIFETGPISIGINYSQA